MFLFVFIASYIMVNLNLKEKNRVKSKWIVMRSGLDSAGMWPGWRRRMAHACHCCSRGLIPNAGIKQGNGHPYMVGGFHWVL